LNVENKAASDAKNDGGREKLTDDTERVQHPAKKINGVAQAPAGFGFENDQPVPVELHPTLLPEPERLTRDRIALRAVLQWLLLCDGHRGKVTAFYFLIGEDTRRPGEIALALGITRKTFENYRAECRIWFDGFIAGLESEAVPTTGTAKP
jgi:hypothetical protein